MKVCRNCGHEMPDDMNFCTMCGSSLEADDLSAFAIDEEEFEDEEFDRTTGRRKIVLSAAAGLLVLVLAVGVFVFTAGQKSDADSKSKSDKNYLVGDEDNKVSSNELNDVDVPTPSTAPVTGQDGQGMPQQPGGGQVTPQVPDPSDPTAVPTTPTTPKKTENKDTSKKATTEKTEQPETRKAEKETKKEETQKEETKKGETKKEETRRTEKRTDPDEINAAAHKSFTEYAEAKKLNTSDTDVSGRDGGYASMAYKDTDGDGVDESIAVSLDSNETVMNIELLSYDQKNEKVAVLDTKTVNLDSGMSQDTYDEEDFTSNYDVYTKDNGGDTYLCIAKDQDGSVEEFAGTEVIKIGKDGFEDDVNAQTRQSPSADQISTVINGEETQSAGDPFGASGEFVMSDPAEEAEDDADAYSDDEDYDTEYEEPDLEEEEDDEYYDGDDEYIDDEDSAEDEAAVAGVEPAVTESIRQINEKLAHTGISIATDTEKVTSAKFSENSADSVHIVEISHSFDDEGTFRSNVTDHTDFL